MTKEKYTLTQERLKELLNYNPNTGVFIRKVRLGRMKVGSVAGTNDGGRNYMSLLGKSRPMHSLAILYVTGEWPAGPVTHVDGDNLNDAFNNLFVRVAGAELTQELLKKYLHYNTETGVFTNRISRNCVEKGSIAGWQLQGYLYTSIGCVSYALHVLAWFYEYGVWPKGEVDHKNHIKDDNRICNLRDVTKALNGRNLPRIKGTQNKHTGLYAQPNGKFAVAVSFNGVQNYLGVYFEKEALQVRDAAYKEHGYHPNHGT